MEKSTIASVFWLKTWYDDNNNSMMTIKMNLLKMWHSYCTKEYIDHLENHSLYENEEKLNKFTYNIEETGIRCYNIDNLIEKLTTTKPKIYNPDSY